VGEISKYSGEGSVSEQMYYLTRSVPLHEFCFFIEKPTMLMLRNGNILWTNAEFVCKIYGMHLVIPMLDVPVGKCWKVRVTQDSEDKTVIDVLDKDVSVEKEFR